MRFTIALLLVCSLPLIIIAEPATFWVPDQSTPGDVVLTYGGGLEKAKAVHVWRLNDETPKAPAGEPMLKRPASAKSVEVIQPTASSVKFTLPADAKAGLFAFQVEAPDRASPPKLLNRPELWFAQPTTLQPGLNANELPPGAEIQIVGKNLVLRDDIAARPRVTLLAGDGKAVNASISQREPFSFIAKLPDDIAPGKYSLHVHNGRGGNAGWSQPLAVEVKKPDAWPDKVFNVRDFGAKGDDVTDDTKAVREALAAADKNGGGIVYFPWGTYRLSESLLVPEKTILRGEVRDATLLKWPIDAPASEKDFAKAALFIGPRSGFENLTLVARKVENILYDVQYEFYSKSVPPEFAPRIRPFGTGGDIFLRKVTMHHLLLAARPEQQKPVMESPALNKRYWEGLRNVQIFDGRNCEISDCSFEGGDQLFQNMVNGRIVRNTFANHMGYSWTALGGGAKDVVCEGNDIHASSSWGWGWVGMQRVYSAHNLSYNFVRGEREAMTLDVSAMPTARPATQYWGTPAEVGNDKEKPFLRFPKEESPDGYRTGWTPGCFKGGTVFIRAFQGGAGGGQSRKIIDNSADTIYLDKPFATAPETTPHKMYVEVAPRHERAHFATTTWVGTLAKSEVDKLTAKGANWVPQEFVGMAAIVLDGKGAGQYRVITSNTTDTAALEKPWDVVPDENSVIGVWSLMRHMVVYDCKGYDASAFAQMYGSFYDYTVDSCTVDRTQGIWGQCGWFTQFRRNTVSYAHTLHPGIGSRGPNPEKNAPFGYNGLDAHRLRVTKTGALQYPDSKLPVFVDEVLGRPVPTTLGHIQKGNTLRYGQRFVVQMWTGDSPPGPRPGGALFRDMIFDDNSISDTPVGIQIGPNVAGVVLSRNTFHNVEKPVLAAKTAEVTEIKESPAGTLLFADGTLNGWVEEQHDFFQKKHPNAKTWSVKDGVVSCDGSLGNCGFLRYDKKLADFTLTLDYRMSPNCNSGVCIRSPVPYNGKPEETTPSGIGYEVQIQDDGNRPPTSTTSGAFYNALAPKESAARPAGEWNRLEIIARGTKLRVMLNGRIVQDIDQRGVPALRDRPQEGYLLLQNHGHNIEFREVRLKEEKAAGGK